MATIKEILSMSPEERRNTYGVSGIYTDDGNSIERNISEISINGIKFSDYSAFSFVWEKSYIKSPTRSSNGSIGNLNSYATFIVPHLKINFSLLSIDDYRKIMKLIYSYNEFTVKNYDVVYNRQTTNKMYFATEEMPKLWTITRAISGDNSEIELLGVQDYIIELIGTNAPLDEINVMYFVRYYDENAASYIDIPINESTQYATIGDFVTIDCDVNLSDYASVPSNLRFDGNWISENGENFINGETIRLNDNLILYTVLKDSNNYTLSLDFGYGETIYHKQLDSSHTYKNTPLTSINVIYVNVIANDIVNDKIILLDGSYLDSDFLIRGTGIKAVEYEGENYYPYNFLGWYWSTTPDDSAKITETTVYDYNRNVTMHQLFEPRAYRITPISNVSEITFPIVWARYGEKVTLATPEITGKTFKGWYKDSQYTKSFDGICPPKNITVYAKWE